VTEAILKVDFNADQRDVSIFALQQGKEGQAAIKQIHFQKGVTSPIVLDLAKFPEMKPDANGAIHVGVEVGSHPDPLNFWHNKGMSLTIKAKAVGN
jgi:hypothetical protein